MSTLLRVIAVICGVLLLLPGLCTVFFGGVFALGSYNAYGSLVYAAIWLVVGGLLCWAGWVVLAAALRRRD